MGVLIAVLQKGHAHFFLMLIPAVVCLSVQLRELASALGCTRSTQISRLIPLARNSDPAMQ